MIPIQQLSRQERRAEKQRLLALKDHRQRSGDPDDNDPRSDSKAEGNSSASVSAARLTTSSPPAQSRRDATSESESELEQGEVIPPTRRRRRQAPMSISTSRLISGPDGRPEDDIGRGSESSHATAVQLLRLRRVQQQQAQDRETTGEGSKSRVNLRTGEDSEEEEEVALAEVVPSRAQRKSPTSTTVQHHVEAEATAPLQVSPNSLPSRVPARLQANSFLAISSVVNPAVAPANIPVETVHHSSWLSNPLSWLCISIFTPYVPNRLTLWLLFLFACLSVIIYRHPLHVAMALGFMRAFGFTICFVFESAKLLLSKMLCLCTLPSVFHIRECLWDSESSFLGLIETVSALSAASRDELASYSSASYAELTAFLGVCFATMALLVDNTRHVVASRTKSSVFLFPRVGVMIYGAPINGTEFFGVVHSMQDKFTEHIFSDDSMYTPMGFTLGNLLTTVSSIANELMTSDKPTAHSLAGSLLQVHETTELVRDEFRDLMGIRKMARQEMISTMGNLHTELEGLSILYKARQDGHNVFVSLWHLISPPINIQARVIDIAILEAKVIIMEIKPILEVSNRLLDLLSQLRLQLDRANRGAILFEEDSRGKSYILHMVGQYFHPSAAAESARLTAKDAKDVVEMLIEFVTTNKEFMQELDRNFRGLSGDVEKRLDKFDFLRNHGSTDASRFFSSLGMTPDELILYTKRTYKVFKNCLDSGEALKKKKKLLYRERG